MSGCVSARSMRPRSQPMTTSTPTESTEQQPELSVVVMGFNEAATLRGVVLDALSELEKLGVTFEVLIVDDGSTDATAGIAASLVSGHPDVRAVRHSRNGGLGRVYHTGFAEARGRILTFLPADGQFPGYNVGRLYEGLLHHDMALGYLAARRDGLFSQVLSRSERTLYRVLLGPIPRFQGLIMFRRTILEEIRLASSGRGWGVLMELVVRASRSGYRLASVLTHSIPRPAGRSKVRNPRTILSNIRQVLALRRNLG